MNFYDKNIEKAIIAGLLIDYDAIFKVIPLIETKHFYFNDYQLIYSAILDLNENKEKIDLLTVVNKLRQWKRIDEVGGAYELSGITLSVGTSNNIENHCKILIDLYLKRSLFEKLNIFQGKIDSYPDVFDIYSELSNELTNLFTLKTYSDCVKISDSLKERAEQIEKIKDNYDLLGISTGFTKLDRLTNGLQPGDYMIIGARPSMGKTLYSILMMNAAIFESKKKVLFFSLEMSKERISDRIFSLKTGIDSRIIASNQLNIDDWQNIDYSIALYEKNNSQIIDKSGLTIEDIRNISLAQNHKLGINLIIIDHIQHIKHSNKSKNTNDNVTHISRQIKSLAKEINCPVIALSQLNRDNNNRPQLKDLRDSGSLEQDADIVLLLHRYDYEGRECDIEQIGMIENIVAKNRNGEIGMFYTYRNEVWSNISENKFIS